MSADRLHHVVVDGSNIATEGHSLPSLAQLDEAVRAFLDDHPTDKLTVVVDATFGHRIDASEQAAYEEAVLAGELVCPPAGAIGRGDAFVLQIADKAGAVVFSNDSFQEFHPQYPWLFDEGRLIGGKPVPEVGWVFVLRTPVRGPTSRRATKAARSSGSTRPARSRASARASAPMPIPTEPPPRPSNGTHPGHGGEQPAHRSTRHRGGVRVEPVNDALPFIEFVGANPVGSTVEGVVERFSSHGAYVTIGDVHGYVPLKLLGDPPPRSAREVLSVGEARTFVVAAFDPPRRSIDITPADRVPDEAVPVPPAPGGEPSGQPEPEPAGSAPVRKKAAAKKKSVAATKASAEKAAAKKAAPAKKAPAKKVAARKAAAKKAAGTEGAASEKVPAANRAAAKKAAPAEKAPAKKVAARKVAARKAAPAKKAPAKKVAAAKKAAPAEKVTAKKKVPAKKKAAAKKSPPAKKLGTE